MPKAIKANDWIHFNAIFGEGAYRVKEVVSSSELGCFVRFFHEKATVGFSFKVYLAANGKGWKHVDRSNEVVEVVSVA